MKRSLLVFAGLTAGSVQAADLHALAAAFGHRAEAQRVRLSPDGNRILYLSALDAGQMEAKVADISTGKVTTLFADKGADAALRWCDWKSNTRVVCSFGGIIGDRFALRSVGKFLSLDLASGKSNVIGQRTILSWLPGDPDSILLGGSGNQATLYSFRYDLGRQAEHLAEEVPGHVVSVTADNAGKIRLKAMGGIKGVSDPRVLWMARPAEGKADWHDVGWADITAPAQIRPEGFRGPNELLLLCPLEGRQALYARDIASGAETLLYANPAVDVAGVLRVGPERRPVAASYVEDATALHFFDADYARLSAALSKALPGKTALPVDESADGHYKLVWAGSDDDPGRYYRYDSHTHELNELVRGHPSLDGMVMAKVTPVQFPARDGKQVPGYLTLPPGHTDARGLAGIVMPHGGPSARDEWGFNWLAQFFAHAGFAVLQPNFRGSSGYGEAWFAGNGFKSWPLAIADINDGGRYLLAQGVAPKRLAIVGWSYGGYAALQAGVVEPELYHAIVAVAPVTDLKAMGDKIRWKEAAYAAFGTGPLVVQGSPARNAAKITAPVLMFHGLRDVNVDPLQSEDMDRALTAAGKRHQRITYPALAHDLADDAARADLLERAAVFLQAETGG